MLSKPSFHFLPKLFLNNHTTHGFEGRPAHHVDLDTENPGAFKLFPTQRLITLGNRGLLLLLTGNYGLFHALLSFKLVLMFDGRNYRETTRHREDAEMLYWLPLGNRHILVFW